MGLLFRNSTGSTVYVSYAYYDPSCRPVTYAKVGWFRVFPGQQVQVWSGYAGGQTFYYYAESVSGRRWGGPYFTQVPDFAYRWCWNTGCTVCTNVGFGRVDVGLIYFNQIINLTSVSSQAKSKAGNVLNVSPTKLKKVKPGLGNKHNRRPLPTKLKKGFQVGKRVAKPRIFK